ncbi:proline iminopeptidase-family hydrolase [Alicyclobacillus dauci]|uniref:Proline iminopeptidase n=1 Tax=Alicyclobacillus dauci TaxID=1475485 RepID=A0ABY6Z1I4_9BACL|nr:proline iminopeptidase-family hydrolase [Alicyclobacillus dauci]WAH36547.1 proline iminopeptidase-family hydrolase [Alicyclobacillus dauci]
MSKEGFVEVEGGRIWYQINGGTDAPPLVVLHGGPGSAHNAMEGLQVMQDERPVIFYDQLGCGNSDRPTDASLWRIDRFVRELHELRRALHLEQVHLLGHSWGTMLLADYLLTKPEGVVSAIFSSPCLSAHMWMEDANRLKLELPDDVQRVLAECEANGTTDSPAYRKAEREYMKRFVCRVEIPEEERKKRAEQFGELVYNTMWGPSEFCATGNLKDFDRTDQLHEISVPSLFCCGAHDEATPESTKYYHACMPDSQFHVFDNCSHSPLREDKDEYIRVVRDFINNVEQAAAK